MCADAENEEQAQLMGKSRALTKTRAAGGSAVVVPVARWHMKRVVDRLPLTTWVRGVLEPLEFDEPRGVCNPLAIQCGEFKAARRAWTSIEPSVLKGMSALTLWIIELLANTRVPIESLAATLQCEHATT
jgi:hypothetical protein